MSDTMIALLLGLIEGLTEFLPVSSTGHLILASEVIGFTDNSSVAFKIAIQLGAILAVLLVYWRRFWAVGTGLLKMEKGPVAFTRNILLGFAPALVIGVIAYDAIRAAMQTPEIVALALIIGGIIILLLERVVKTVRFHAVEEIPFGTALQKRRLLRPINLKKQNHPMNGGAGLTAEKPYRILCSASMWASVCF